MTTDLNKYPLSLLCQAPGDAYDDGWTVGGAASRCHRGKPWAAEIDNCRNRPIMDYVESLVTAADRQRPACYTQLLLSAAAAGFANRNTTSDIAATFG